MRVLRVAALAALCGAALAQHAAAQQSAWIVACKYERSGVASVYVSTPFAVHTASASSERNRIYQHFADQAGVSNDYGLGCQWANDANMSSEYSAYDMISGLSESWRNSAERQGRNTVMVNVSDLY